MSTRVRFADLDEERIAAYAASGDGLDKAGAYGIQGFAATLVERIDGDYFTVVGFPLAAFARALPRIGNRPCFPRTPERGRRTMSLAGTLRATFSPDLGIDLGTANTVVYSHDEGILVSEPSVVAYRTSDDAIIAVGEAAKELTAVPPDAFGSSGRCAAARSPISAAPTRWSKRSSTARWRPVRASPRA